MAIKTLAVHGMASDSLSDLSILGVPEDQQNRLPSSEGYPQKFSPAAQRVWNQMTEDPKFQARCKVWNDLGLIWHNAIQEFLSLCSSKGVFPFADNTDISKNQYLSDLITRSRIDLVSYFNEIGLFNKVKIRKAYRRYVRKDIGINILSWAELFYVEDEGFETWLQKSPLPRLQRHGDSRFQRLIRPNVLVWVKIINRSRIQVGYEIRTNGTLNIPGRKNPTKKEVDTYMDSTIFLPIVRAHRISSIKTRLF